MISSMSGSDSKLLADLDRIQASSDKAQREMSSGLKVERPSDGPSAYAEIVDLNSKIQWNTQVQSNLGTVKAEVDTADSTLQSAVAAVENAITLGTQGAGSLPTADQRLSLAQQVNSVLQQLVGISTTTVAGRYIFSGDQDQSPAYSVGPDGVTRLISTPSTRQVQDLMGMSIAASMTAQDIFDHRNPDGSVAPDNVFAALQSLQTALENNDQAGITSAMSSLQLAHDHLGGALAFYGAAQNRVAAGLDVAQKFEIQQKAQLSDLEDADITDAALQVSQAQIHQNAALSARAQKPKSSLFDYLG